MNFQPVTELLRQHLGLETSSLGDSSLQLTFVECMKAAKCDNPCSYAHLLRHNARLLERLIEQIVVAETWFFRGGELFWFLAEQIRLAWREAPGQPVRILSIPCSTGEEAYSLAIAALEVGLPPGSWHLDAVDVSRRALLAAGQGLYGQLSFRQTEPLLRDRYFRKIGDRWEIRPEPRQGLRFLHGNLIAPDLLIWERPYDLVFCRNVFIYLTLEARKAAVDNLARLLRSDGLLCTSVTETLPPHETRFLRWGPLAYGLYRRIADRPPTGALPLVPLTPAEVVPQGRPTSLHSPCASAAAPVALLIEARRLADQGHLDDALAGCLALERTQGPSADLFALLGVIHQGRGEPALAYEAFRKALYLQSDHREALTHLMLLAQQTGDHATAKGVQRRLARLGQPDHDSEQSA
ncbi:MAG: CheR family methyltransferase [Gemmataceae bacterium]